MQSPFILGIDLGTTNCALAFVDAARGKDSPVEDFPIPQLLRPGESAPRPLLPSCLYIPGEHELPPGAVHLPWPAPSPLIAGEFARWQGGRVPGRLVSSAKSWLCHAGVDRSADILPWGAPAEVKKISPVTASAALLEHMALAWNHAHPQAPLADQEVVITVPASFDEAARSLTVRAARQAGFKNFTLVEEPQAAFYDFTSRHRASLNQALGEARLILVADVGGGTSDFTLIQAGVGPEGPVLRRIAVGEHLMLGGDNMDTALARMAEERFGSRRLSATQWMQLVQASRAAKEALLALDGPDKHGIAIVSEGSRLLGGTLSTEFKRGEVEPMILDGFFPLCSAEDQPRRQARVALQELGLPYAQDPAITRHLAAFLREHAAAGFAALGEGAAEGSLPRPDAILLNGGVFNSPKIADRFLAAVSAWWPKAPAIPLLRHDSLELAVARGAAYYGLVRRGLGQRIGGGAAYAFYVGLAPEKEGGSPRGVCLIPRGQEEGQTVELKARPFTLTLGRPVQFPLYSTTSDRIDRPGDIVAVVEPEFRSLPPTHTLFKGSGSSTVPIFLRATLTELGTMELWCVNATKPEERWRLEFELRGSAARSARTVIESMPQRFEEACEAVDRVFGKTPMVVETREVKQLFRAIERIIGPRETWRLPLLRELWGTLISGARQRRRSADHERIYFQLLGYALRPGFGYPLDEWRCEQTLQLYTEVVKHHTEQPVWNEFWILWRRIAGGIDESRQQDLWKYLKPALSRQVPPNPPKGMKPSGVQPQGLDEMVRTAASLELLDPAEKGMLGNWIAARLRESPQPGGPWAWALGRLGARVPIHGSGHKTVPVEQVQLWIELLLKIGLDKLDNAAFASAQMARMTADRTRNVDDAVRERVIAALRTMSAPEGWIRLVTEITELEAADEARALGDTLPIGLQLR
jgi:molecular chaperone DnaK (HSP70)